MDEGRKRVLLIAARHPRGKKAGAVRQRSAGACHGERHRRRDPVGGKDNGRD